MADFVPPALLATFAEQPMTGFHRRRVVDAKLGAKICELRARARMSIEAVSSETGIPAGRLQEVEAGTARPTPAELYKIVIGIGAMFTEIFADFA